VRFYRTESGYRARTLHRDLDGTTRHVERSGRSKAAADAALKAALRDRMRFGMAEELTPDTAVKVAAEQWFAGLKGKSPSTTQVYRRILDHQVLPSLGALRLRELTVGTVDRFLRAVTAKHGPGTAKTTRSVLSGVCGLAARHDALDRNPVRDAGAIETKPKTAAKALTAAEAQRLLAGVRCDEKAISRDLPDFIAFMLATGCRIGEAAAVTWKVLDLEAGTVDVRSTIIRVKGEGLIAKSTKTDTGARTLVLPPWSVEMLRRRLASIESARHEDPVFPAPLGGWRDPSNTQRDLRDAFDAAGFPKVSSHILRKTVASLMEAAGLSSRAAADQLGHSHVSMTTDTYFGRKVAATGAATALQVLQA
jgi:integrase